MVVSVVVADAAGIVAMLLTAGEKTIGGVADVCSVTAIMVTTKLVHHVGLFVFDSAGPGGEYGA